MIDGGSLFWLHDTHGFQLVDSMAEAHRRGMRCDLFGFAFAALEAGWNTKRVQAVIREAIADSPPLQEIAVCP